jgi:hypothetical protein
MQALEKKPQNRQQSMRELAQALRHDGAVSPKAEEIPKTSVYTPPRQEVHDETATETKKKDGKRHALGWISLVALLGLVLWFVNPFGSSFVSLVIRADKTELKVNERAHLTVFGVHDNGTNSPPLEGPVEWSSNSSVVTVNSSGEVEGRKSGSAEITARYGGLTSAPVTIYVKELIQPVQRSKAEAIPPPQRPVTPTPGPVVTSPRAVTATKPPENRQIQDHIKVAGFFRDRGEYTDALAELEKAKAIDPSNAALLAEIQRTRNACLAEKAVGNTNLRC